MAESEAYIDALYQALSRDRDPSTEEALNRKSQRIPRSLLRG
jgi:hypothetical protein